MLHFLLGVYLVPVVIFLFWILTDDEEYTAAENIWEIFLCFIWPIGLIVYIIGNAIETYKYRNE